MKKNGKMIGLVLAIAITLTTLFSNSTQITKALSDNPDWRSTALAITYTGNGHSSAFPLQQWILSDAAGGPGEVAFCVQMEESMYGDFNHYRGSLVSSLMNNYGFSRAVAQEKSFAVAKAIRQGWLTQEKSDLNYAITQLAIWDIINPNNDVRATAVNQQSIDALSRYALDRSTVNPSFHNQTLNLAINETQILTDSNEVITALMLDNGYQVNVEKQPAGQPYALTLLANHQLRVRMVNPVPNSRFDLALPPTNAETIVSYNSDISQDTVLGSLTVQDPASLRLNINLSPGELLISKVQDATIPFDQIAFALNDANGNLVNFVQNAVGNYSMSATGTVTALAPDASGKALLRDLLPGNYTVTETSVFPGTYTVSIGTAPVQSGNRTEVTVTNAEQTGTVTLTKMAEQFTGWTQATETYIKKDGVVLVEEKPQVGVVLQLKRLKKVVTAPVETTTVPNPTIVLTPTETTTAATTPAADPVAPLALADAPTETTTVATTEATTEATTAPTTVATEDTTAATTAGAAGGGSVNSISLEAVADLSSDATGKVTSDPLPVGHYFLYHDGVAVFEGDVAEGGVVSYQLPIIIEETPRDNATTVSATVNKANFANRPLAGAVFTLTARENIYALDGTTLRYRAGAVVKTATTNVNGQITMIDLPLGKYNMTETSAPAGYVFDSTPIPVDITAAAPTVEVIAKNLGTITNRRIKVSAVVNKQVAPSIFGTDGVMQDITFGVYTQVLVNGLAKDSLVALVKPDANGRVLVEGLVDGRYYMRELSTNTRYDLNPNNYIVDIATNGNQENQIIQTGTIIPNAPTLVGMELVKLDAETNEELDGAIFELNAVGKNGELIPVLNGEGTNKYVSAGVGLKFEGLEEGQYQIKEVQAPDGYVTEGKVIDVILDKTKGDMIRIEFDNLKTTVEVSKYNTRTSALVRGAILALVDDQGIELERWTTDGTPHTFRGLVVGKSYSVVEIQPAKGYVKTEAVNFTIENEKNGQNVLVGNQETDTSISKQDIAGAELPGASMQLLNDQGAVVAAWISGTQPYIIYGLEVGKTYTLHEDLAPLGYATASDVAFTILDSPEQLKVVMVDEVVKVELSKKDATTGNELPGAAMQLLDDQGNVVEAWTSTSTPHVMTKLEVGKTYTLHEDLAPLGYATATDVEFTVTDTGVIQKVEMIDEVITVEISKQDATNGKELPSATLMLFDDQDKKIEEWTSTDKPHIITKLEVGKTYTLYENLAPLGYATASSVSFTIADTGVVQKVVMKDEVTKVEISKKDVSGNELPGASMQVLDDQGKVVEEWISTETPHLITKLEVGKTYTLHEDLAPIGYAVASDIEFIITDTGVAHKVTMIDEVIVVELEKSDLTDGKPVEGAEITIYNDKGEEVFKGKTDENGKTVITGLEGGKTYTFKETIHPYGYTLNEETFTFTINKDGTVEGTTEFTDEPTRFEIKKTNEKNEAMKGVGFQLFTDAGVKVTWTLVDGIYIADANGKLDTLSTTQHGDIFMHYLPTGKYVLKETTSPKGYQAMKDMSIELKVNNGISNPLKLSVKNELIPVIPRTGEEHKQKGVWSALLLLAALILSLDRKRRNRSESLK